MIQTGTSGFNYTEWKGSFYPADLPNGQMLTFYGTRFPSVEINYSFYRMPTEKIVAGWAAQTPSPYKLTLKAPRRITHDNRLCVVAVARGERYAGLGVDIEPAEPLEPEIAARIWSPVEAEQAARRTDMTPALASRLVFSAKEAFYKCQFPLTRTFLGFMEVSVALGDGTFEVRLERAVGAFLDGTRFAGRWLRVDGQLLTAVVLPRSA